MAELDTALHGIGSSQGTYILVIELYQQKRSEVGRLGTITFKTGTYLYTGSALGSGGLAGRVHRHLRPASRKRSHWHIDALTSKGSITDIWWCVSPQRQECIWAEILSTAGERIASNFGSSDCYCAGHLVWLKDIEGVKRAWEALRGHVGPKLHRARSTEAAS